MSPSLSCTREKPRKAQSGVRGRTSSTPAGSCPRHPCGLLAVFTSPCKISAPWGWQRCPCTPTPTLQHSHHAQPGLSPPVSASALRPQSAPWWGGSPEGMLKRSEQQRGGVRGGTGGTSQASKPGTACCPASCGDPGRLCGEEGVSSSRGLRTGSVPPRGTAMTYSAGAALCSPCSSRTRQVGTSKAEQERERRCQWWGRAPPASTAACTHCPRTLPAPRARLPITKPLALAPW